MYIFDTRKFVDAVSNIKSTVAIDIHEIPWFSSATTKEEVYGFITKRNGLICVISYPNDSLSIYQRIRGICKPDHYHSRDPDWYVLKWNSSSLRDSLEMGRKFNVYN